ncbi:MAG: FAD-dependent oxidoreductase [Spirochaetaceae bacterium]|jgi:NADPH-dependent 2,4-dienoyl-CoA reductase/sulfur reductase-like enzyme/CxxC motif-containing protein|nr:FAD-dependent oxidoreductase [Spirochaetaceae bacterium]
MKEKYDVVIIGGGPAGLAAALSAKESGAKDVLLLERNNSLGGILNQCIHNGFGLHYFKEELTGPEYAARFIAKVRETDIEIFTGAMVLDVGADRIVHFISKDAGYMTVTGKAVILAMGCRERPRGAIGIPGARPAGVFTAGAAQLYINIEGYQVGKRVIILGSGDIGLIMARRLTLEGAKVLGVFEVLPYSGGLTRNLVQCLSDYDIPLRLSHTITEIRGDKRVEQVVIQKVDENRLPIPGTEQVYDCDTVLLSVGLIPENELTRNAGIAIDGKTNGPVVYENMETAIPGIFACGNVAHVHDLVDFVSAEAMRAGKAAAVYAAAAKNSGATVAPISIKYGEGVGYVVPQKVRPANVEKATEVFFRVSAIYKESKIEVKAGDDMLASFKREHLAPGEMEKITLLKSALEKAAGRDITISVNSAQKQKEFDTTFRVDRSDGVVELICINCPKGCRLQVDTKHDFKVTGNTCEKGEAYGKQEVQSPTRVITSTVIIRGAELKRMPVKTDKPIHKGKIFEAMKLLDKLEKKSRVNCGDVVVKDICGTGASFVSARSL